MDVNVDADRNEESKDENTELEIVDLMCPLTMELLKYPVRIIGEDRTHVFSKNALLNWRHSFRFKKRFL